ncbi:SLC13 family permease [Treponema sp. Marseille-Q4523]|uniref:SLC13 family permease n=1 Tax=Treponema sp. Marseille-Q4523 TaxID=2810610 RepID=UPI001960DB0D|nr:SLC13 family permease [Treponema sp. Marseille-Q4523]MBM7022761.1 TRAP transporter large permease subunit [Treponema sp. Marseille-Q4523]
MEMKWVVLTLAVMMYALVIIVQHKKIVFTSASALVILLLGAIFPESIFSSGGVPLRAYPFIHAFTSLVNWNVLMIYVGSMIIAALFIYSRMPAYIADIIVEKAPNTGIAIVLILAMTGVISIFVENVATVLVMAPIALALCKKLKIDPTYFMIGLAVMSNLEGTATLVGDPPSMIFASYAGYTFNDFFVHAAKPSIFFFIQTGMITGCLYFYLFFAKQKEKPDLDKSEVISPLPFFLLLAMIFGLAAISFLHFDCEFLSGLYVLTLGIAGVLWFRFVQRRPPRETWLLIKGLDWETIAFLIGIFIVVGAISETGLLSDFAHILARITGGNVFVGFMLILVVSVVISGFVDNVPYIIVMLPVAQTLASRMDLAAELYMFALLIGSCLGGNLTPFGASANVVAMGILKREGYPVNFAGWLKTGAPFTILTTAAAAAALWFVWA